MSDRVAGTLELFCERWVAAPPALVFRALTEPPLLERWFCPSADVRVRVDECDPRPGGRYRFVYSFPDGRVVAVIGEYRTLTPSSRLTFTWTWEPPDPWAGHITFVAIDLVATDGGTDVRVHHQHFASEEMQAPHQAGWGATLERMATVLARVAGHESEQ